MPTPRYLLVSDVDRTLLTDDYQVLPTVRDAVQDLRSSGIKILLATARGPVALETVLDDLGQISAAICFGGALTVVRAGNAWVRDEHAPIYTLEPSAISQVIEKAKALNIALALYSEKQVFVASLDAQLAREFAHTGDQYVVGDIESLAGPFFKILAISPPDESQRLRDLKSLISTDISTAFSHSNYLEIGPKGASKGAALAHYCARQRITMDNVVAVGDSENDISMLATAGYAIAMGNATAQVKNSADWVTTTNTDSGLATAIAHCRANRWTGQRPNIPNSN